MQTRCAWQHDDTDTGTSEPDRGVNLVTNEGLDLGPLS